MTRSPRQLLELYLTDHRAGASAGIALARRCKNANAGTALADVLADIEREIDEDRAVLDRIIADHGLASSRLERVLAKAAITLSRLRLNGWRQRGALSRVMDLEALAGGIAVKARLWAALRMLAADDQLLDADELDELIARAARQLDRVSDHHREAARAAFGGAAPATSAAAPHRSAG